MAIVEEDKRAPSCSLPTGELTRERQSCQTLLDELLAIIGLEASSEMTQAESLG